MIRLLRLSNSLPAAILVLIGAWLSNNDWPSARAWLAALSMWFVTAFGYASNDLWDINEDRINKPDRPLPSGSLSLQQASRMVVLLLLAALLTAALLGLLPLLAAAVVLLLLWLYNIRLKGLPAGGNLLIACLAGCTQLVGSVAVNGVRREALAPLVLPSALLICFVAAREMVKTLEDVEGDRAVGKRTVAIQYGKQGTLLLVALFTLLFCGLTLYAWWQLAYSSLFLLLTTAGVLLPLIITLVRLWQNAATQRVSQCLAMLKASYFVGILALLLH